MLLPLAALFYQECFPLPQAALCLMYETHFDTQKWLSCCCFHITFPFTVSFSGPQKCPRESIHAGMGRVILAGHTSSLCGFPKQFPSLSLLCTKCFISQRENTSTGIFLAGSVPHKSTQVMPNRTSMAWPKPWNAQQDITAHQEQGLPTSTRVQRAPTATSPGWQTPGTAGPVLGAHSVPGQVGIVCG